MEKSGKISTLQFKKCSQCGELLPLDAFRKNRTRLNGLEEECRNCRKKRYKIYYYEGGGREVDYRYRHSPRGKELKAKREQSPEYKERRRRFWLSDRGREKHYRWLKSEVGRAWYKRYISSGRHAKWQREWICRIQDEVGCHAPPDDFYPAYRLLIKPLKEGHYKFVDVKY